METEKKDEDKHMRQHDSLCEKSARPSKFSSSVQFSPSVLDDEHEEHKMKEGDERSLRNFLSRTRQ